MGFLDRLFNKNSETPPPALSETPPEATQALQVVHEQEYDMTADWAGYNTMQTGLAGNVPPIVNIIYNGEKNFGELGPVLKHIIDHDRLGQRAWQLDLESETAHTIVNQKGRWVLGMGLKLQAEPQAEVLNAYKIKIDTEKFNTSVEALWKVYAFKSFVADYAKRAPLQKIAKRALKNAMVRGDVLVVLRVDDNNNVKVQIIDGQHVGTPLGLATMGNYGELIDNFIGYDYINPETGNRIRHGVEISDTGEHVAYHVRNGIGFTYTRIPARDSYGNLRAYLVYGSEHRLDNVRGIPQITPSMESAKQLDDYTSATVGSAVERQRIAYTIEHELGSTEEDPRQKNLAKVVDAKSNINMPRVASGEQVANTVAASTNKNTFNLPAGSKLTAVESKQELHYKEFHDTRAYAECATLGIPPEVAFQLYGSSYSASRAATNGFQFMLNIDRDDFGNQFYQPIYNLQLDLWVMTSKVQAPGYLDALRRKDEVVLAAYRFANWLGDPVPQIDELKEVQAARLKLGIGSAHLPLSTFEKVVQDLGEGNAASNMRQYAREMEEGEKLGIDREDALTGVPVDPGGKQEQKTDNKKPAE